MILITGDTHGSYDIDSLYRIRDAYPSLTKNDYVIVAGDFGGCFDDKNLEYTDNLRKEMPFTILFVDGNHENFDKLNAYPVEEWNGGKVHKLFDDVIHLMRGEVFNLNGENFLTIGGAESVDRIYRKEHESWWSEETITEEDIENAKKNILRVNKKIDYVISHTCPASKLYEHPLYERTWGVPKKSERRLEEIYAMLGDHSFKKWYFGHWHEDVELKFNFVLLYHEFYVIQK